MHVADPLSFRLIWLPEIKILRYLSPDTHNFLEQIYLSHHNSMGFFQAKTPGLQSRKGLLILCPCGETHALPQLVFFLH